MIAEPSSPVESLVRGLSSGDVVDRILEDAAAWRADVIMIGTHARRGPEHSILPPARTRGETR
jgi:nucleotide-binding universal stress UspA family protein